MNRNNFLSAPPLSTYEHHAAKRWRRTPSNIQDFRCSKCSNIHVYIVQFRELSIGVELYQTILEISDNYFHVPTLLVLFIVPAPGSEQRHKIINAQFVILHLVPAQGGLGQLTLRLLQLERLKLSFSCQGIGGEKRTVRIRSSTVSSMVNL